MIITSDMLIIIIQRRLNHIPNILHHIMIIFTENIQKIENNPGDTGPKTTCFNVTYGNGISPDQLQVGL